MELRSAEQRSAALFPGPVAPKDEGLGGGTGDPLLLCREELGLEVIGTLEW